MFVDEVVIWVRSGKGGPGAVAFRRQRFQPTGGPSGGDGGKGGDVVVVSDPRLTTLLDYRYNGRQWAESGTPGMGKDMNGKNAADLQVPVPVGTVVIDPETNEVLADLSEPNARFVVARGGRGGLGNMNFATPTNRSPRFAQPGEAGEEKRVRLELKLLADVGIIGFPNAGKSTLISRISRARPKIADYPFTTLVPNLGVVGIEEGKSFVVADVPGLIPGASEGAGLGIRFLRHVERTRVLLHLLAPDPAPGRGPLADFEAINRELRAFDPELGRRHQIVAWNKCDTTEGKEQADELKELFLGMGLEFYAISGVSGDGLRDLTFALWRAVRPEAAG